MPRKSKYPITDIFLSRWSGRAMSGELVTTEELMPLFEAARWAPSALNEQPWRFIFTQRETKVWHDLIALMTPFNQSWVKGSGALVVLLSKNLYVQRDGTSPFHTFDAGAAWMSLALQGSINGLVVHAIGDFDYNKTRLLLNIPAEYTVELIIAIGKPGDTAQLSPELQRRETPNDRKPLSEIIFEDSFD